MHEEKRYSDVEGVTTRRNESELRIVHRCVGLLHRQYRDTECA